VRTNQEMDDLGMITFYCYSVLIMFVAYYYFYRLNH